MKQVLLMGVAGVSAYLLLPSNSYAQTETTSNTDRVLDQVEVISSRLRNSADTAIGVEQVITNEEIMSYGIGSIEELIAVLGPQASSNRGRGGGRPVVLVDGVRVSGFREIRNYPPEAIERVDILPEEAALKYGFRANQRVLNFILKPNFNALTVEVDLRAPVEGAGLQSEIESNFLNLQNRRRFSIDGEFEIQDQILEEDRGLFSEANPGQRSLTGESQTAEFTGTYNVPLKGEDRLTLNADLQLNDSRSLNGLSDVEFVLPADSPFSQTGTDTSFSRFVGAPGTLERQSESVDADLKLTFVKELERWRLTTNAGIGRSTLSRETDLVADSSPFQAELDALNPVVAPDADLSPFLMARRQDSDRETNRANINQLINGDLWSVPAGDISTSFSLDLNYEDRTSETRLDGVSTNSELDRTIGTFQASFDFPLINDKMDITGVHALNLNLTGGYGDYSDFGGLSTLDATLDWEPTKWLGVLTSYTLEEGAPSITQLGDTVTVSPNVEVFDFATGQQVLATRIDGGNAGLGGDTRHVFKVTGDVKPFEKESLNLSVSYLESRIEDPIGGFPSVDAEIEAAFPDRFVRDNFGNLISYDTRPVNYIEENRRQITSSMRWRKTFAPEKPKNSAGGRGEQRRTGAGPGRPASAGRGGSPGGAAGGRGSDRSNPRMFLSLNHVWTLENTRHLADGLPEQDFLNGSAIGANGGASEHEVSFWGGYFHNGSGFRLRVNWQSETEVSPNDPDLFLSFSDLLTADLRLSYTVQKKHQLAKSFNWLEGVRFSVRVDNMFDETLTVTNADGQVANRYEGARIDPNGRVFGLSVRKQF